MGKKKLKILPTFYPVELELLQAFNAKQLELTHDFIADLDNHVETYTTEVFQQTHADDVGEVVQVEMSHIGGISEEEYDFKGMFSQVMPMYQRQSMLVTNWGIFENELKKYYSFVAQNLGQPQEIPRKNRGESALEHILRIFRDLGVLNETTPEFTQSFDKLNQEVRFVRNDWVHYGGVPTKTTNANQIEGISINGGQMDVSSDYVSKATNHMWMLSGEISSSANKRIRAYQAGAD